MADDEYTIAIDDDTGGHAFKMRFAPEGDEAWLDRALKEESTPVRIRSADDEDDTEGHLGGSTVRVVLESGDDTEGHAISIHFPSREEAGAFRKRLVLTGVLAGTVALGAAGGIGLANLSSSDAGSAGAAQSTTGSAWTQDERANLGAASSASTTGSAWTQDERANLGAAASATTTGSAWTADERPAAADSGGATDDATDDAAPLGGPQPR